MIALDLVEDLIEQASAITLRALCFGLFLTFAFGC
jgi:hypothetical protein